MGQTDNWGIETGARDFLAGVKKTQDIERRRKQITKPSDLVGPGIDRFAIRLDNFNDPLATFNGYFAATGDAYNSPGGDATTKWVGVVVSDAEYGGYQEFTRLDTGVVARRVFTRAPYDPETITWQDWI